MTEASSAGRVTELFRCATRSQPFDFEGIPLEVTASAWMINKGDTYLVVDLESSVIEVATAREVDRENELIIPLENGKQVHRFGLCYKVLDPEKALA